MDFKADYRGLGELLKSPDLAKAIGLHARLGLNYARQTAPVGKPPADKHPGEFRDGLQLVEDAKSEKGDRVAALIIASSDNALAVEFGNKHRDASRVLRKTIDVIEEG